MMRFLRKTQPIFTDLLAIHTTFIRNLARLLPITPVPPVLVRCTIPHLLRSMLEQEAPTLCT